MALIYFGGKFFRSVVEAINKWQPADAADKETDHRKAVAGFLRTTLPGYTIIEEYGNERSRADLVICSSNQGVEKSQEKFVIELKYRMSSNEVDPESWTGRIVNPKSEERSTCPRNDVCIVPI